MAITNKHLLSRFKKLANRHYEPEEFIRNPNNLSYEELVLNEQAVAVDEEFGTAELLRLVNLQFAHMTHHERAVIATVASFY